MKPYLTWAVYALCLSFAVCCEAADSTPITINCDALQSLPVTYREQRIEIAASGFSRPSASRPTLVLSAHGLAGSQFFQDSAI